MAHLCARQEAHLPSGERNQATHQMFAAVGTFSVDAAQQILDTLSLNKGRVIHTTRGSDSCASTALLRYFLLPLSLPQPPSPPFPLWPRRPMTGFGKSPWRQNPVTANRRAARRSP